MKVEPARTRLSNLPHHPKHAARVDFSPCAILFAPALRAKTADGTPSYAAKVIGEWSILKGTLRRYDDFGNIAYGIFGSYIGFTKARMLDAADLNQRIKDVTGKIHGNGDEDRDKFMIETRVFNAEAFIKANKKERP